MANLRNHVGNYGVVAGTLLVGLFAFWHGLDWYDRAVPGLLVDPDLAVSSIMQPSWDGSRLGFRFPDQVLQVNGRELHRVENFDEALEQAQLSGSQSLRAHIRTSQGTREVELGMSKLAPPMWWVFSGGLFLIGLLYTGAAMLAMTVRSKGRLACTFAKAAILFALFVFTLFDYHTSRRLVPLFLAAFSWVPFAALALALRLPRDVSLLGRFPWGERVLDGMGALLATVLVLTHVFGGSTLALRTWVSPVFGVGLFLSALVFIARMRQAKGNDRLIMRALFFSMVPSCGVVGVAALLVMMKIPHAGAAFFVVPVFALVPLSSMVAFVRHDLWSSRALLPRMGTRIVLTMSSTIFAAALASGILVLSLDIDMKSAFVASSLSSMMAATFVVLVLVHTDRILFRSRVEYKPTVEQLSEELTAVTRREQVGAAVENTVRRWLAADSIAFHSFDPAKPPPPQGNTDVPSVNVALTIPARFQGTKLGLLLVGPKPGGALFSDQDLDLLRTIANLAAVALAHADRYEEVERRRREQAETWKGEKVAIVETLAAEITHEIRYPINFFRSLFKINTQSKIITTEEVEIGCEEVERLSRLVSDLQRVTRRKLVCRWVPFLEMVRRSETLFRDRLGGRRFEIDVPEGLRVRCDADQVMQVLVNLMSNALDAALDAVLDAVLEASLEGRVGVRWEPVEQGGRLVVWDEGSGFDVDPGSLFLPLYTTKASGTGLGLAIAHRIVRAHHWRIDGEGGGIETRFMIAIPRSDIRWASMSTQESGEGVERIILQEDSV